MRTNQSLTGRCKAISVLKYQSNCANIAVLPLNLAQGLLIESCCAKCMPSNHTAYSRESWHMRVCGRIELLTTPDATANLITLNIAGTVACKPGFTPRHSSSQSEILGARNGAADGFAGILQRQASHWFSPTFARANSGGNSGRSYPAPKVPALR